MFISILGDIGEIVITIITIIIMVIGKVWTVSCDFFGGGWVGQIITLGWMLIGGLFVVAVTFTFTINRTQSGIEMFSASTMTKLIGAFVVVIIFIGLVFITSQPT